MQNRSAFGFAAAFLIALASTPVGAQTEAAAAGPDGLEAAPRIEMREFRAFKGSGTASITGNVLVQTKLFGTREMFGSSAYLIPDTSYSTYVEHVYRDSWLHGTTHQIDRGVLPYILKFTDSSTSKFTFSKLVPGTYLVFVEVADSAAEKSAPCVANYNGFDSEGRAVEVPVPVYCYTNVRHDFVFMDGSVTVGAGETATVKLSNDGEVAS